MKILEVRVICSGGLHVKPASELFMEANQYLCRITVRKNGDLADGKQLMELLNLGVCCKDTLCFEFEGSDEEQAYERFRRFSGIFLPI